MEGNLMLSKVNTLLSWITKLAYLNVLWMLFSLLGLFVIGFFPATVAMLTVCRKWLEGEEEFPIYYTFLSIYRSVFVKSNLMGLILTIIGGVLYVNYLVLEANIGQFHIIIISAFYLVLFLYLVTVSHVIPLFIMYEGNVFTCIKNALVIGVLNLDFSLAILISQSAFFYLMFSFPGSALFFLGSILSIIQMWLVLRSINRMNKRLKKKLNEAIA